MFAVFDFLLSSFFSLFSEPTSTTSSKTTIDPTTSPEAVKIATDHIGDQFVEFKTKSEVPLWAWVLIGVLVICLFISIIINLVAISKRASKLIHSQSNIPDATSETSVSSVAPLIVGSQVANQEKRLPVIIQTSKPVMSRARNRAPPQMNANILSNLKAPAFMPPVHGKDSSNFF